MGDSKEPGVGASVQEALGPCPIRPYKGVLCDVCRILRVASQLQSETVNSRVITFHELVETIGSYGHGGYFGAMVKTQPFIPCREFGTLSKPIAPLVELLKPRFNNKSRLTCPQKRGHETTVRLSNDRHPVL